MLTDHDYTFGPVTWGRSRSPRSWGLYLCSGGIRPNRSGLYLRVPWWVLCVSLPPVIRGAAGAHRRFGFQFFEDLLWVYYGRDSWDGDRDQRWSWFLPWKQWRHVRTSLYDLDGKLLCDEPKQHWGWSALRDAVPRARFALVDYDGTELVASTFITEREWRFGTSWCRWLAWLRRPRVRRSLEIEFSKEVGPGKGSWKGGTIGHAIEMLPGELHESAMRRYCAEERKHKATPYRLTFVGPAAPAADDAA